MTLETGEITHKPRVNISGGLGDIPVKGLTYSLILQTAPLPFICQLYKHALKVKSETGKDNRKRSLAPLCIIFTIGKTGTCRVRDVLLTVNIVRSEVSICFEPELLRGTLGQVDAFRLFEVYIQTTGMCLRNAAAKELLRSHFSLPGRVITDKPPVVDVKCGLATRIR